MHAQFPPLENPEFVLSNLSKICFKQSGKKRQIEKFFKILLGWIDLTRKLRNELKRQFKVSTHGPMHGTGGQSHHFSPTPNYLFHFSGLAFNSGIICVGQTHRGAPSSRVISPHIQYGNYWSQISDTYLNLNPWLVGSELYYDLQQLRQHIMRAFIQVSFGLVNFT